MIPGPRRSGFSLIEVLCALAILAIGLVGLTQALTTALRSTKESEIQTAAALIAAGLIETLRAEGSFKDGETEGACGEGLKAYRWRQTLVAAGLEGLHDVTVTVLRADTGRTVFELKTLLFEPPAAAAAVGGDRRERSRSRRQEGSRS